MRLHLLQPVIASVLIVVVLGACQTTPPTPTAAAPAPARTATAVPPEVARNLANNCFACHGPAGRSPGAIPSLANSSAAEIAVQLKRFRSGQAFSTVMGRHAKGYSDAEIEAVAEYIAGLRKK